jgi:hypothetical protein
VGPGIVFETDWDTRGAIQVTYDDSTLKADVASPEMEIGDDAVITVMEGHPAGRYAFGSRLWLYNVRRNALYPLPDGRAAHDYLQIMNPSLDTLCLP